MTIDELRKVTAPLAAELERLAEEAEADEFAPWVCEALRESARFARLEQTTLSEIAGGMA